MTDNIFDENCSYCAEGALLDAFGIKIGELPMEEKNLISHRGKAFRRMWAILSKREEFKQ